MASTASWRVCGANADWVKFVLVYHIVTGVIGVGVPPEPVPAVRDSREHDPELDGEYAVIAITPSTAVAVLARRTGWTDSEFEFGVIRDRQSIVCAARCPLRKLGPQPAMG
jgi:hypothetical protein